MTTSLPIMRAPCGKNGVMDANAFAAWFAGRLAALPWVAAVALGGLCAAGTATDSSDWDFALYYRGAFDPDDLRALGFDGEVFDVGAWGGGADEWRVPGLSVEGRRVDVMYRDLNDVEHWWKEAGSGRYEKQLLPFHVARHSDVHRGGRTRGGHRAHRRIAATGLTRRRSQWSAGSRWRYPTQH